MTSSTATARASDQYFGSGLVGLAISVVVDMGAAFCLAPRLSHELLYNALICVNGYATTWCSTGTPRQSISNSRPSTGGRV